MFGMSNEQVLDFNRSVIEQFRANDGVLTEGPLAGNPTLLVTMTGAKSGRSLTSPLTYITDGDDYVVMASAGGSEQPPAWLFNMRAHPEVVLEVATDTFDAVAIENEPDDRARLLDAFVEQFPRFGDYQSSVERTIPIISLRPAVDDGRAPTSPSRSRAGLP